MYLINVEDKMPQKIQQVTFTSQGLKERYDLQEWIVKDPEMLGEEILIIQKEFSGFEDTNERLDLLGLDKNGNLVIIENKLDDSGRDVMWQATKYASYCSTLSKNSIRKIYQQYLNRYENGADATQKISEFLDDTDFEEILLNAGQSQRIILVAANFRKEVTSTVLWLRNFGVDIKCVKVTPYVLNERLLVDTEVIIPVKEVEEYTISVNQKEKEENTIAANSVRCHQVRMTFWKMMLEEINKRSELCKNISPTKDNWLNVGSGLSGVSYTFSISGKHASVELSISRSDKRENEIIFDNLYSLKEIIEKDFGHELQWERLDDKKMCRIAYRKVDVNIFNEVDHQNICNFLVNNMLAFNNCLKKPIEGLRGQKELFK